MNTIRNIEESLGHKLVMFSANILCKKLMKGKGLHMQEIRLENHKREKLSTNMSVPHTRHSTRQMFGTFTGGHKENP